MAEYLFVYGSLLSRAAHPTHRVLRGHASLLGEASTPGRLFDLGSYPGAVPDPSGRERITGELYLIKPDSPLLQLLDEYEGCRPEDPLPHPYRRVQVRVETAQGRILAAWLYLFNHPVAAGRLIESGNYLDRIRQR